MRKLGVLGAWAVYEGHDVRGPSHSWERRRGAAAAVPRVATALRVNVEAFWAETVPPAGRPRFRPGAIPGLPGPRVPASRGAFRDRTSPNPTPSRRTPLDCSRTAPGRPKRAARPPQIKKLLTGTREAQSEQWLDTGAVKRQVPAQVVLRDAEHQPSNLERAAPAADTPHSSN